MFDSLTGVDDLARVQFFRHRVDAHEGAVRMVQRLLDRFDEHSKYLRDHSRHCEEYHIGIIHKAWLTLAASRRYLANSYVAAFGIAEMDDATKEEFNTHQSQLQVFVEQLNLLSDNVRNIAELREGKDFQRRFKGIDFCSVAVNGYVQRVDSFMRKIVR